MFENEQAWFMRKFSALFYIGSFTFVGEAESR